jgi:hypothetical protein
MAVRVVADYRVTVTGERRLHHPVVRVSYQVEPFRTTRVLTLPEASDILLGEVNGMLEDRYPDDKAPPLIKTLTVRRISDWRREVVHYTA